MVVFGIFTMYVLGAYVSWKTLATIAAVFPLAIAFTVYSLQDSPTSYIMRGRPEMARKSLIWLRNSAEIQEELYAIQKSALAATNANSGSNRLTITNILCVRDPTVRRPLLVMIFLMVNQQLCGINAVVFFTVSIFASSGSTMNAGAATIVIGAVMLAATAASAAVVNRIGRRPTLILTQSLMTAALLVFGAFFYVKASHPETAASLGFVPLSALVVFITAFSFGLGPLAWLMLGELLPPKAAGVAGSLASMVNWFLAFAVTLTFTYLIEWLGDYGAYWLFAAFCVLGTVVTLKFVPETRNKTLREIQSDFMT